MFGRLKKKKKNKKKERKGKEKRKSVQVDGNSITIRFLGAFTAETAGEGEVAGLDRDALGVESAEVGVAEETGGVSFGCFLDGGHAGLGPAETFLVARSDGADHALERSTAAEETGGLLECLDLAHGDCARAPLEALLLLDRKSTRLNSSHSQQSRMPSSA